MRGCWGWGVDGVGAAAGGVEPTEQYGWIHPTDLGREQVVLAVSESGEILARVPCLEIQMVGAGLRGGRAALTPVNGLAFEMRGGQLLRDARERARQPL